MRRRLGCIGGRWAVVLELRATELGGRDRYLLLLIPLIRTVSHSVAPAAVSTAAAAATPAAGVPVRVVAPHVTESRDGAVLVLVHDAPPELVRHLLGGWRRAGLLDVTIPALTAVDAETEIVHVAIFDIRFAVLEGTVYLATLAEFRKETAHLMFVVRAPKGVMHAVHGGGASRAGGSLRVILSENRL